MMFNTIRLLAIASAIVLVVRTASAETVLLQEAFESGTLSNWTGKNGGTHHGQIVADPLSALNHVLNFAALDTHGDMFTASPIAVNSSGRLRLTLDYLGLPQSGSVADDFGGFLGVSVNLNPQDGTEHFWTAGTDPSYLFKQFGFVGVGLTDDGQWHHHEIDVTPIVSGNALSAIHIMIEDYVGSNGVAGDAYFDNIALLQKSESGLAGDFNQDNMVNAADYVMWRKINGPSADYDLWRAHYVQSIGGSGSSIESASVPEPSTRLLLAICANSLLGYRRTKF